MDAISDMIIRIKNASSSKKDSVVFPYSKLKLSISEALVKAGFIKSSNIKGKKIQKFIEVVLLYGTGAEDGVARITGVDRVSKSSKRVYNKSKDIRKVKSGYGNLILSTPKGIMTDKEAREANVGGEALFKIW